MKKERVKNGKVEKQKAYVDKFERRINTAAKKDRNKEKITKGIEKTQKASRRANTKADKHTNKK